MDLQLEGNTVLITGASQGIGAAVAEAFAEERCNLVLVARSGAPLEALSLRLRERFGIAASTLTLDLTSPDAIARLEQLSGVDVLVNNAGAIPGGDLQAIDARRWREAWALKVFGYIDLCRLFYRKMRETGSGVMVNNIGASADYLDPAYIAGSTGTAALVAFTRALGSRSLDDGIRVVGINPGPVGTERLTRLLRERAAVGTKGDGSPGHDFPLGRPATVREVADLLVYLASPRSAYTSGIVVNVDGGLSARHGLGASRPTRSEA